MQYKQAHSFSFSCFYMHYKKEMRRTFRLDTSSIYRELLTVFMYL